MNPMSSGRTISTPRFRSLLDFARGARRLVRRLPASFGCAAALVVLFLGVVVRLQAGTLSAIAPSGASATVTIRITGTGFDAAAANNEVTFRATTGETAVATPTAVVMVDATRGLRRLTLRVPSGLPVGRADITVVNRVTSEVSTGLWLEVVGLVLPSVASGAPGATDLQVRITGSANAKFAPGSRAIFGTGITVNSTTVESPTSVVANITIAASAVAGPRTVTVVTTTQTVSLVDGFLVAATPPPNRNPSASANGPYAGIRGQPMSFSSVGSSDPDGDPLQFSWNFGDGSSITGANPEHTYATADAFTATVTVTDGRGGTASASAVVTISPPPNRAPTAVASAPAGGSTGDAVAFSSAGSLDPDGDPLQYAWDFGDGSSSTDANPQHAYASPGRYTATLTVVDGRGGSASATVSVAITTPVTLVSLGVNPPALRFSQLNATTGLVVTGRYSDGSERDATAAASGTIYTSSILSVAIASADGLVTAVGNGNAAIAIANGAITANVPVAVEQGVTLQALELAPPIVTLRGIGSTAATTLRGSFSDGSLRDLTSDPGTSFTIDDGAIASISGLGVVTALAPGAATITVRNGGLSATAQVRVIVTDGSGFLRGEAFDDSRGLPLLGVTATLLIAGGNAVVAPQPIAADDRGRFTLPAASGGALVKVERDGFTSVERQADLARGAVSTLLDARLTRLDSRVTQVQSVFGGEAASADGSAALSVPSGSLDADTALRVTAISNQGLQGVLPVGWSPIAVVDVQPAGRLLTQPATLRLPHADTLAAGSPVALALYDAAQHRWVVQAPGRVSDDRRTLTAPINATGQFAFVIPDESPVVPPPPFRADPRWRGRGSGARYFNGHGARRSTLGASW